MIRRILLADASPTIRTLVRLLLAGEGLDLVFEAKGEAVLATLGDGTPTVVLADSLLEGIDGLELCRRISSDPATRSTPVLLLSPAHAPISPAAAAEAGARGVLRKPFDRDSFLRAIRDAAGPRRATPAPSTPAPEVTGALDPASDAAVQQRIERTVARLLDERLPQLVETAVARWLEANAGAHIETAAGPVLREVAERVAPSKTEALIRAEIERLLAEE